MVSAFLEISNFQGMYTSLRMQDVKATSADRMCDYFGNYPLVNVVN